MYGRRRVGKTFLIRSVLGPETVLEVTGIQHATTAVQMANFRTACRRSFPEFTFSDQWPSWLEAFEELRSALEALALSEAKPVVFLDELPWLATRRSGFLQALGHFWNSWAVTQRIMLVVCGSAASWMINKVVNDRGGLHNRVTRLMQLIPFTLAETDDFCRSRNVRFTPYQTVQVYMTFGGVPMYLDQLSPSLSAMQNIRAVCFAADGYLYDEFDRLFASLFTQHERHVQLVRMLAEKRSGLSRAEIVTALEAHSGGGLTRVLSELVAAGFISRFVSFGRSSREAVYRLTDPYVLFYLTFLEKRRGRQLPTDLTDLPQWNTWSGYAFENVWLTHIPALRRALQIGDVSAEVSTFYRRSDGEQEGLQVDLLIDRRDQTINLCEIKFTRDPLRLSARLVRQLQNRRSLFEYHTGTRKNILTTLLTTYEPLGGPELQSGVDRTVTVDALFAGAS